MAESKFKKMEHHVEREGHSETSARKIAAAIGRRKFGKKGMAKKAAAGRKRHH